MKPGITEKPFGKFESTPVTEYTIANANGMEVSIMNYGATVTKIITADRNGVKQNITLGFDSLNDYIENGNQYIGSIVGRYCNRIANGKFNLDGKDYTLAKNNNENSLHGGLVGFDKVCWNAEKINDNGLRLIYQSKDGEEGFPGNLNIEVKYTLSQDNELIIDYSARTDKATPVNLTSHCYFNLSGDKNKSVLDHELKIFANLYTTLNEISIPTGELVSVKNDRLDFTIAKKVGQGIYNFPGGYDINFVLNNSDKAAEVYDAFSGRFMEMFTTEPGLQFYVGKSEDGNYSSLCLEAQHFPDSPNKPSFPNTILRPGETYTQKTIYKFSVK